jgi:hypothetical protein
MLDEHLFDCLRGEVWIDGLTAQRQKIIKGRAETRVRLLFVFD